MILNISDRVIEYDGRTMKPNREGVVTEITERVIRVIAHEDDIWPDSVHHTMLASERHYKIISYPAENNTLIKSRNKALDLI